MSEERARELAELAAQAAVCTRCALAQGRTKVVFGVGDPDADLMLVGEAPGYHEDQQGEPFVGPAGKLLDRLLAEIGRKRSQVYIANVLKCRPPGNRDPLPEEVETCTSNYLQHQIRIVDPSIIVTLGRFSMGLFFKGAKITQVHGQMRKVADRFVIAMYHPAAALHQMSLKPAIMADFAKLPDLLKQARAELGKSARGQEEKKEEDHPKQMSLF